MIAYDVQADGKIYVGLNRRGNQQTDITTIYRLNTDGSVDNTFTSISNNIGYIPSTLYGSVDLKILPDGQVFIFGRTAYGSIAPLNPDGSKKTSFESPALQGGDIVFAPRILSIALQSNGQIVVAGVFTSINGLSRHNIARLNADGSVDISFNPSLTFGTGEGAIRGKVHILSGDKLLFADDSLSGQKLLRLNADGHY